MPELNQNKTMEFNDTLVKTPFFSMLFQKRIVFCQYSLTSIWHQVFTDQDHAHRTYGVNV